VFGYTQEDLKILMTPMGSSLGDGDGICGDRIRAYYAERAKGGVALQIMGSVAIGWPVSGVIPNQAALSAEHRGLFLEMNRYLRELRLRAAALPRSLAGGLKPMLYLW